MDEFDQLPREVRDLVNRFGDLAFALWRNGEGTFDIQDSLQRLEFRANGRDIQRCDVLPDAKGGRHRKFEIADGNTDAFAFVARGASGNTARYIGPYRHASQAQDLPDFWCIEWVEFD